MKPLGAKKMQGTVPGHQDCQVCHPAPKGGRAAARREGEAVAEEQLEGQVHPAELRVPEFEEDPLYPGLPKGKFIGE